MRSASICLASALLLAACGGDDSSPPTARLFVGPAANSTGAGTVSGPPGMSCTLDGTTSSGSCAVDLETGVSTTLTAAPSSGSLFGGWSTACTGTGSCTVTMTDNQTVQATFVALQSITVAAGTGSTGSGTVSSSPVGIDCIVTAGTVSGACSSAFPNGSVVTLSVAAAENSVFTGWTGACTGSTCAITVAGPTAVTAGLATDFPVQVSPVAGNEASGIITSVPAGISCTINGSAVSGACASRFNGAAQAVLTATPSGASSFAGWTGAGCGGSPTCTVQLTASQAVQARFVPIVQLAVAPTSVSVGSAVITSAPAGINCTVTGTTASGQCTAGFVKGADVALTATPSAGTHVFHWAACAGTGACNLQLVTPQTVAIELQDSRALSFAAAGQFAQVPDAPALDLGGEWTIEAWVRPRSASEDFQHVISKWGAGPEASYSVESRQLRLRVAVREGADNTVVETVPVLTIGGWQHVAATLSNGTLRLYVNGVQHEEAPSLTPQDSPTPLTFGREAATGNLPYPGELDEVRFWNYAKTGLELRAGMSLVLTTPAPGLIGYWRFDEPSGQVIVDLSPSGNNGTLGASAGPSGDDAIRIPSDAPIE